jgi:hypothetical protein
VDELVTLFGAWLTLGGHLGSGRDRLFTPSRTFWLFLAQVFSADGSCREVVRRFLGWLSLTDVPLASPNTGAYCRARARLPREGICGIHRGLAQRIQTLSTSQDRWYGRDVKVVDGTSISMPDTPENQERYPQSSRQKPGCGFPIMNLVGVFSLATGVLIDLAKGHRKVSEQALFRQLWDLFAPGEVALTDRKFCSFAEIHLMAQRDIDVVMRNHQCRIKGIELVKRLGKTDRLIRWIKTKVCPKWLTQAQWEELPDTLLIREITCHVDVPGFRTKTITVVTTLLDATQFPTQAFTDLYRRRWMVELFFDDIKTTMGMDILRCKTPDMVEKELYMHLIAYNLVRALMLHAAREHAVSPFRLSFKGTVDTVRTWSPLMAAAPSAARPQMYASLLKTIARDTLPIRPNRVEPRARKRRPKNYQRLTENRHVFKECPHRNKYRREA